MRAFDELIQILERLLGPDGCPWDQAQTLHTLRTSAFEEVCELIEAIDLNDNAHILEELGDLFFNVTFLSLVAEKEKRLVFNHVLEELNAKLIRRHPHIFGEGKKIHNLDELHHQWESIKKEEKGKENRVSVLDGISKTLPSLARAQKILGKIKKTSYEMSWSKEHLHVDDEKTLGQHLLSLVQLAQEKNIDAEQALRNALAHLEKDFLDYEKNHS